jgi:hypothetical protein
VIAALVAACATAAQPDNGETLYLVLRVGPDITEKDIISTLKQGLKLSGSTITGEPTIRPVSPAFFEEFQGLVERAGPPVVAADDGLAIRMLPASRPTYEIRIARNQVLKKLRVTYQKAGEKEYVPTAPDAEGKSQLILIVPGQYAFMPDADDVPVSYEGDVAELGKPNLPTVKGGWPKGDRFYVVTMRNFRGDRKEMFRVIQDPQLVANPLDNVQLGNDLVFVFANLNSSAADPGEEGLDAENNINVSVETIPNRSPRRVWAYFPLDEDSMKKARDAYVKLDSNQLPIEIRKDHVPITRKAEFGPKDEPKWVELPAEPTPAGIPPRRFSRKVKIDDLIGFAEKYPKLWMLVVWEFDNGRPEAIQVRHPMTGNRVFVLERERAGWQKVLKQIPKKKG